MDYELSFFVNLVRWTSAVNIFVYFYFHLLLNSLKEQTADIPRMLWYCASTVHHFKSLFNVFLTFEDFPQVLVITNKIAGFTQSSSLTF